MAEAQGLFKMDRIFGLEMFGCQFQISLSAHYLFNPDIVKERRR
jgi:hypothetical protein